MSSRDKSVKFNRRVGPLTTIYDDVIIPSGSTWRITQFFGSADFSGNTNVAVIWDRRGVNELLFGTYGTGLIERADVQLTGDGVKYLSVRLQNSLTISTDLFGSYIAAEVI